MATDMEDIVRLVDGRPELPTEMEAEDAELKGYLARELSSLLDLTAFTEAVPAHLLGDPGSQARAGVVLQRVRAMACHANGIRRR